MLTQKFCGSCGTDLADALDKRREKIDVLIADAAAMVKRSEFNAAIAALRQVVKTGDFRLGSSIKQAEQALHRVIAIRDRADVDATALQDKAEQAAKLNDHERVVSLLKRVPEGLLSDTSRVQLRHSTTTIEQLVALNGALQSAMAARDWKTLGSLVGQLLVLAPDNANYQQIAAKVADRLISSARKRFENRELDAAAELLESVPDCQQHETFESLSAQINGLAWLTSEVVSEPFASIGLGRLAVRLAKQGEQAEDKELVKQLAASVKKQPQGRNGLNSWKGDRESWLGGEIGVFAQTAKIHASDAIVKQQLQYNSQLNVAIGLAIQGVGAGRVSESFLPAKKGLLKSLSRRKNTSAWGVDIGATALRAVLLSESDEGLTVEDVVVHAFDTPTCRIGSSGSDKDVAMEALAKFATEKQSKIGELPIWINISAAEIVNRSISLPPLKDKQAAQMLEQEISQLLPMNSSDLRVVSWMAPLHEDPSKGRPVMIAAARKVTVEKLVALMESADLKLVGIQSDAIAIANLIAYEFEDDLAITQSDQSPTAVVVVDSGAVATSAILVTDRSINVSTFESAGEDLTKTLARETKTRLPDADLLKHDPASISSPGTSFPALEAKMQSLRQRLERAVGNTKIGSMSPTVTQTWVVGGGARCHGWVKHVLGKSKSQ